MNYLFYDTETTGKANMKEGIEWPEQPRLVQLAAILTDSTGMELASINHIIEPDGWEIPLEAANVHGISTERAKAEGVPVSKAMLAYVELMLAAEWLVAHNHDFDYLIIGSELHRARADVLEQFKALRRYCTMRASTNVVRLPGRFPGQFKWPKLQEAHEFFFGESFEGAHDALADVRACKRVFFELMKRKGGLAT